MSDDLQPPPEMLEQQAHRLRIAQTVLDQKILQAQDRLDRLNREQQTLQYEANKVRRAILEDRNKGQKHDT